MNIDFDNPIYIILLLLVIVFSGYYYTRRRKLKRIKLLKSLGFRVNDKVSSIQRAGLIKLAPEIMSPKNLSFGHVNVGPKDPEVWWHAKKKNDAVSLSLFKIYKIIGEKGDRYYDKAEMFVAAITLKKNLLDQKQLKELSLQLPRAKSFGLTDKGAYFVYDDLFFSYEHLIKLTEKIMGYQAK
jgi:hypothetical protein